VHAFAYHTFEDLTSANRFNPLFRSLCPSLSLCLSLSLSLHLSRSLSLALSPPSRSLSPLYSRGRVLSLSLDLTINEQAEWAVFEGVDNAHLHAASHRAEPLRTISLLPDYQYKRGGYSGDDSTSPQTDPAGSYYGDYSGGVHTGSYGAVSVQGTSHKAARRAPSSHQSHVAQHPARKAPAAEGSDAAARAAMHAAIHPGIAASKKTTPKKATPPKTSSPPAANGAVSGAAEAAASYTDRAVSPAAEAAAVADEHEAAADERSLQRQWADAMGVVAPARAESRRRIARQGLLATPKGMAHVHHDGAAGDMAHM